MKSTGIFYATEIGHTEMIANQIAGYLGLDKNHVHDVGSLLSVSKFKNYGQVLLGVSTWGAGDLQADWIEFLDRLQDKELGKKKIALFGLGDQVGYPEMFVDGMRDVYDFFAARNMEIVGAWPDTGYAYTHSRALKDGKFVGLALDQENQPEETPERIQSWLGGLRKYMAL